MQDTDCVAFLQQVLPRLHMRWQGFRRVRKQVCKRLAKRLVELDLPSLAAYRDYLQVNQAEWQILDGISRVTVSRFYRDKRVFSLLEKEYLPGLARRVMEQGGQTLKIWSAGCASGEEPYSLSLLWEITLATRLSGLSLDILATDANASLLARAKQACYNYSSIKNLPEAWRENAFIQTNASYCLQRKFCRSVDFRQHDVRNIIPDGPFDLVLCRNLVFTYFDIDIQLAFLDKLQQAMSPQGILLLGVHELLPETGHGFTVSSGRWGFYRLQSTQD